MPNYLIVLPYVHVTRYAEWLRLHRRTKYGWWFYCTVLTRCCNNSKQLPERCALIHKYKNVVLIAGRSSFHKICDVVLWIANGYDIALWVIISRRWRVKCVGEYFVRHPSWHYIVIHIFWSNKTLEHDHINVRIANRMSAREVYLRDISRLHTEMLINVELSWTIRMPVWC